MTGAIRVMPWPDPVLDAIGHDPRSWYVETFWLPTLGPTALLLLRHLADRFEDNPKGIDLPVADTAAALGLGPREGQQSPLDPQPHPPAAVRARVLRRRRHDRGAQDVAAGAPPPRAPAAHRAAGAARGVDRRAGDEAGRRRAPPGAPIRPDAARAGRADRRGRTRAARRRVPSRARARSRALGARTSPRTDETPSTRQPSHPSVVRKPHPKSRCRHSAPRR